MGTLAALRASMSRWTVRWETSRRSESSRLVTRPLAWRSSSAERRRSAFTEV